MYLLTDSDGWNTSRTVVRQTSATLKASEIHAPLATPLGKLLPRWVDLDVEGIGNPTRHPRWRRTPRLRSSRE